MTAPELLNADLVLVDEISMLDMFLTWHLFQALPPQCRLILVGDADQLPSVGPGAVLSELIACGKVPVVMLDKCPIKKHKNKTLGEVLREDPGAINWIATKYTGDADIVAAAKLLCEESLKATA